MRSISKHPLGDTCGPDSCMPRVLAIDGPQVGSGCQISIMMLAATELFHKRLIGGASFGFLLPGMTITQTSCFWWLMHMGVLNSKKTRTAWHLNLLQAQTSYNSSKPLNDAMFHHLKMATSSVLDLELIAQNVCKQGGGFNRELC